MTAQAEKFAIPLPTKFLEQRRDHFAAEYARIVAKIGPYDTTDLKDIVALSVAYVQLSQVIEMIAERRSEEECRK